MNVTGLQLRVLVARAVFADVVERLHRHFEVQHNQTDVVWSQDELIQRLQGIDGVFVTGTEAIDATAAGGLPATARGVLDGGGLRQHRRRLVHCARRAGEQCAGRAHRNHRRLRFRTDDGRRTAHHRERTLPARRPLDALGPRHVRQCRCAWRHARRGHGAHRPGHCAARPARQRSPGAGAALRPAIAPCHRRGRTGADGSTPPRSPTSRAAASSTTRHWRWRCASGALPRLDSTCSKANPPCTPIC